MVHPAGQRCKRKTCAWCEGHSGGQANHWRENGTRYFQECHHRGDGQLAFPDLIVRGERVGIRLKDLDSAAVRNYRGPDFFPLNINYRVVAKWEPAEGNRTVDVPNVLGDVTPTPVSGTAVFRLNGQEFRLTDLSEDPKTSLFFVFSYFTSKTETYPGGRFLDAEPPENGTVVLDFNRAYNPPCSVTPYATCPLAPKENRLALAIPVGEKYDHKSGHH